jgi:phosphate:Na+ symporter
MSEEVPLDWLWLGCSVAGTLALQLHGIATISRSLRGALGARLPALIHASCNHPVLGFLTGTAATAALSSSSATSMLVVQFLQSGAMTLEQSLPVALGIHVGSTVAPLLAAVVPVSRFGLPLAGLAYFVSTFVKHTAKHVLTALWGLGLLLLGLSLLSHAVSPLRSHEPVRQTLALFDGKPLLGAVAGGVLTVLVQSSTAAIAIAVQLASAGTVSERLAVAMVIGANVGTCVVTVVAAAGKSSSAWRFSVAYLVFKLVGAVLALLFFSGFVHASERLSLLVSRDRSAADVSSWSHVLLNAGLAAAFLPITPFMARLFEHSPRVASATADSEEEEGGSHPSTDSERGLPSSDSERGDLRTRHHNSKSN